MLIKFLITFGFKMLALEHPFKFLQWLKLLNLGLQLILTYNIQLSDYSKSKLTLRQSFQAMWHLLIDLPIYTHISCFVQYLEWQTA